MTPAELADEIVALLELDSDLDVEITPYDRAGTAHIVDLDYPNNPGLLVEVSVYE